MPTRPEDRCFAAAVATDRHVDRSLAHVEVKNVRTVAADHPGQWGEFGSHEMHSSCKPDRCRLQDALGLPFLLYASVWNRHSAEA